MTGWTGGRQAATGWTGVRQQQDGHEATQRKYHLCACTEGYDILHYYVGLL